MWPLYVAIALVVAQFAASGPSQAQDSITIGNSSVVVRTVTGTLDDTNRKISLNDDVYHNELVETAASSATEIVFLDETKLALGPESSLVLDSLVFDPDPAKSSFITTTTKGVFRFVTGNLPKKSYTIHTPNATIGIPAVKSSDVWFGMHSGHDWTCPLTTGISQFRPISKS